MKVEVDRDSVAAGDDVDPHTRRFTFPDNLAVEEVIERIVGTGYLPSVAGPATWSVTSGVPLAVIGQGISIKWVPWQPIDPARLARRDGVIGLRFNYHAGDDPAAVLSVLKRLRLDPFTLSPKFTRL